MMSCPVASAARRCVGRGVRWCFPRLPATPASCFASFQVACICFCSFVLHVLCLSGGCVRLRAFMPHAPRGIIRLLAHALTWPLNRGRSQYTPHHMAAHKAKRSGARSSTAVMVAVRGMHSSACVRAAGQGHDPVVRMLLKAGADIDHRAKVMGKSLTPLMAAALSDHTTTVQVRCTVCCVARCVWLV